MDAGVEMVTPAVQGREAVPAYVGTGFFDYVTIMGAFSKVTASEKASGPMQKIGWKTAVFLSTPRAPLIPYARCLCYNLHYYICSNGDCNEHAGPN
jgi:hypothetical protein